MGAVKRRVFLATVLCAAVAVAAPGDAAAEKRARKPKPVDVVLLFDTSGSMLKTDPMLLRYQGAKQITQFLGKGDRLAIVGFSEETTLVRALKPFLPENSRTVDEEIEGIKTEGKYTDLFEAVKTAQVMLEGQSRPGVEKSIVLISDGKMEPSPDKGAPFARTLALVHDVLPVLKSKEIRVYTLALSDQADRPLLAEIAGATGGMGLYAANPSELKEAFSLLFEAMVPSAAGRREPKVFYVDDASEETTFYLTHDPESKPTLVSPKGEPFSAAHKPDYISWFSGERFDVVTIKEPDGGDWEVEDLAPFDAFAAVLTNLKLAVDWPIVVRSEEPALLQARLYESDKPVSLPDMSSIIRFGYQVIPTDSVSAPIMDGVLNDEGRDGDKVAHDGIFSKRLQIDQAGEYRIALSSKSPTFSRFQQVSFRVKPKLLSLDIVPGEEGFGHHAAVSHEEEGEHGEAKAHGASGKPALTGDETWIFRASVSKETSSFKEVAVSLIARSADRKRFEIPLRRSPEEPLVFEVTAEALPRDGTYTVYAQVHGLSKNRQVVEARTEEVAFQRETSARGKETAAKVVVREVDKQEKLARFPLAVILAITAANVVIGVAAYMLLWRKPTVRSAPAPKYIPQKSLLDAIGDLETRVTQKDISIDDPIFEKQADAQREQAFAQGPEEASDEAKLQAAPVESTEAGAAEAASPPAEGEGEGKDAPA